MLIANECAPFVAQVKQPIGLGVRQIPPTPPDPTRPRSPESAADREWGFPAGIVAYH